jgi:hypothetical protein
MGEEPEYTPGLSNTVSWSDESASGAVEYFVGASEDPDFPDPQQLELSSGWITDTEYEFDDVLEDGVLYYYRVRSRDAQEEMSDWSDAVSSTQDASGPDPVTDLDAVGRPTYIRLTWSVVEDDGIGTNNYRVYRSETAGELGNRIMTVDEPFYGDENVQPQVTYWYTVRPVDEFGNETLEGNNQDDAEIQWLEDPDLMIMEPSSGCYVTELDALDISGVFYNTLAIWVNDIPARMTLDPVAGEFVADNVPIADAGPNLVIAYGEGSFDRSAADTLTVVRLPDGSGDPVVTFTFPEAESYHELGAVIDITGEVENVGCLTVMGEPVDIDWSADYSTGTFAYTGFELTELGEVTISAEGLGSPAPGEMDDRVATAEVSVYVVAPPPLAVEITSPEDGDVFAVETVTVEGTFSGAWKVEVNGMMADLNGGSLTFSVVDVPLEIGPNEIQAVAYGEDDATVEDIITVYRTQEPEPNTPTIEITYPPDDFITNLAVLEVTGTSSYAGYVIVSYEGGDDVMADLAYETGVWSAEIALPDPPVTAEIVATAYGVDENAEDSVVIIVLEADGPPAIEITYPPDDFITTAASVVVQGTAENVGLVFVNDVEAAFDFTNFELETGLVQGWNTIIAVGYGADDQMAADTVRVYSDQECEGDPGEVAITSPEDGFLTGDETITVAGTSNCIVSVDVNGVAATLDLASGDWEAADIPLEWGANTITATGINYDGGEATASVMVHRLEDPSIAITSPEDGSEFEYEDSLITVSGTSTGLLSVMVNGVEATLESSTGEWSLSGVHLDPGFNTIAAVGQGLEEVSASITVERLIGPVIEYHGIFTPNGDGYNDEANIPCDENSTGAIYARDGQEVRESLGQPVRSRDNRWYLQWDGRDNEGTVVKSGVYLYQVDNDGDMTTGTIVVAR